MAEYSGNNYRRDFGVGSFLGHHMNGIIKSHCKSCSYSFSRTIFLLNSSGVWICVCVCVCLWVCVSWEGAQKFSGGWTCPAHAYTFCMCLCAKTADHFAYTLSCTTYKASVHKTMTFSIMNRVSPWIKKKKQCGRREKKPRPWQDARERSTRLGTLRAEKASVYSLYLICSH